jgi:hypothetical protein
MVVVPACQCQPMKSSGPVRQLYAGVIFIPQVRDYELGYCLSDPRDRNCTHCPNLETFKKPRNRFQGIDCASLSSLLGRYVKYDMGCRTAVDSCARNYRPNIRENKPKTLLFYDWKRAFWACFREYSWVYKFGHWAPLKVYKLRPCTVYIVHLPETIVQ